MEHENKQAVALDESDLALLEDEQLDAVNGGATFSGPVYKPFPQGIIIDPHNPLIPGGGQLPGGGIPNGIPALEKL